MSEEKACYVFVVEWFDSQAALVRAYRLSYYLQDDTLELFDVKNRRTFLKRCSYPTVRLQDLYIGAQISVYARLLKVVAYGDEFTRRELETKKGRTLALVKPDAYEQLGKIIDLALTNGFTIGQIKMCKLSLDQAAQFYKCEISSQQAVHLANGTVVALELIGDDCVQRWKKLIGNVSDIAARAQTIVGQFGTDAVRDAVHGSATPTAAIEELDFFFNNPKIQTTAQLTNYTVCVIKPHCVLAGYSGKIIDSILDDGYEITAMQQFILDRDAATEFLQVYKTVVPGYAQMVDELCSGPCIAMEIRSDEDIVPSFRELCGPMDPEIGKLIRPKSIRSRYGIDKVKNAVHCTDLPEDGPLESEYFFSIL